MKFGTYVRRALGLWLWATLLTACTPSVTNPWTFAKIKDKITDKEVFHLSAPSLDRKFGIMLSCSVGEPLFGYIFSAGIRLGSGIDGSVVNEFRVGSKGAISQKWVNVDNTTSPLREPITDLLLYIGEGGTLLGRLRSQRDVYDTEFNVTGTQQAVAKLKDACK